MIHGLSATALVLVFGSLSLQAQTYQHGPGHVRPDSGKHPPHGPGHVAPDSATHAAARAVTRELAWNTAIAERKFFVRKNTE